MEDGTTRRDSETRITARPKPKPRGKERTERDGNILHIDFDSDNKDQLGTLRLSGSLRKGWSLDESKVASRD